MLNTRLAWNMGTRLPSGTHRVLQTTQLIDTCLHSTLSTTHVCADQAEQRLLCTSAQNGQAPQQPINQDPKQAGFRYVLSSVSTAVLTSNQLRDAKHELQNDDMTADAFVPPTRSILQPLASYPEKRTPTTLGRQDVDGRFALSF